jgi:hypothetical protein
MSPVYLQFHISLLPLPEKYASWHSRCSDYATSLSVRGSNPGKGKTIQTSGLALGPTQPPVKWVIEFFVRVKRPVRGVIHPLPSTEEIKKEWSCTSIQLMCLYSMGKETFTSTFTITLNRVYTTNAIAKAARRNGSARCRCLQTTLSGSSILLLLLKYQHYYIQGFNTVYSSTCVLSFRENRCLHISPDDSENRYV